MMAESLSTHHLGNPTETNECVELRVSSSLNLRLELPISPRIRSAGQPCVIWVASNEEFDAGLCFDFVPEKVDGFDVEIRQVNFSADSQGSLLGEHEGEGPLYRFFHHALDATRPRGPGKRSIEATRLDPGPPSRAWGKLS